MIWRLPAVQPEIRVKYRDMLMHKNKKVNAVGIKGSLQGQ